MGCDTVREVVGTWRVRATPVRLFAQDGSSTDAVAVQLLSGPLPKRRIQNPSPEREKQLRDSIRPILIDSHQHVIDPALIPRDEELQIVGTMSEIGYSILDDHRRILTQHPGKHLVRETSVIVTEIRRTSPAKGVIWRGPARDPK
jgi:hypothetical protein